MRTQLINIFISGGIFMWPIAVLSLAAIAIIFERIATTFFFRYETRKYLLFLKSRGREGKSLYDISGKQLFDMPADEMEKAIEQELQMYFDRMHRTLEYLSAIGSIAPLLGFIGTVSGMISSFQSIASANKVSVTLVAGGISEALITTGFGLIIAVVCLSGEHIFRFYLTLKAHRLEEEISALIRKIRYKELVEADGVPDGTH